MGKKSKISLSTARVSSKKRARNASLARWSPVKVPKLQLQQPTTTKNGTIQEPTCADASTSKSNIAEVESDMHLPTKICAENIEQETIVEDSNIIGRRIVSGSFFLNQILGSGRHAPFDCSLVDMTLIRERRRGLFFEWVLQCSMCNLLKTITSDSSPNAVNNSATLAALSVGIGYSQVDEFMASINVPFMSTSTYQIAHQNVASAIHTSAWESMARAGEEEKKLALEIGDVTKDGVPYISVVCDGAWSKRSYKSNYNAASGAVRIVQCFTCHGEYLGYYFAPAWDILLKLKENGLIAKHTHEHIIRFSPPLVITKEQTEEAVDIIVKTIKSFE